MMQPFDRFLENKPLYYKEIDHERVHTAYGILKPHIREPRTIHVVGTNGKGSTGRMVAYLAHKSGLSVGHFSSPHILRFNERIWLNGSDSRDDVLEEAHQKLFRILGNEISEKLSYFEYTTLLALVVFEHCDLMVLEAGLGGEFDATNVCDKVLSIITPIGIDHQAFLGESIEEIAGTKIRSIQTQVLLAPQVYDEV
ncbi:MAG: bifunctional folylpolyglutamate synthase/dihydrofolate synthase, partial [Sulfurovum sp.]|nr:bifunctional folylpolyglutamate synthase/dihydrofolate synthase [Sulfurovum sp.]NNJ44763.1 bifunctional folylpolyglutamate synthase/dihydrofolate synthase [Sulfurovum sp.]